MNLRSYTVKIYKDGQHVDTQTVQALDEGKAKTAAMAQTKIRMMGAVARYEVTEVKGSAGK